MKKPANNRSHPFAPVFPLAGWLSLTVIVFFGCPQTAAAQVIDQVINPAAVGNIEKVLSADSMEGRATFSPGIEKAAAFIEKEFRKAGLKTNNGSADFRQPFSMVTTRLLSQQVMLDSQPIDSSSVITLSTSPELKTDEHGGYEKAWIKPGMNLFAAAMGFAQGKKNRLVLVDTSFSKNFARLNGLTRQQFASGRSVVFVLTTQDPTSFTIDIRQELVKERKLTNLVGILPGKSRPSEYVIFSAHYDHLGIGQPDNKGDSIFNGANDDASGSTAVIMLARYFGRIKNNARTLVFATFAAEEIGGFGSQYFSGQFDPAAVQAMFNIEMIGTESKWGTNSAYITGFEKTSMGAILQQNLKGSKFNFNPDPYPQQSLFYRSDNATLARQGVPAHTISTSKMDSEKYYHTAGDEIGTLDMTNMSEIIKAIAISAGSIISGKDSPTRVDTTQLQ